MREKGEKRGRKGKERKREGDRDNDINKKIEWEMVLEIYAGFQGSETTKKVFFWNWEKTIVVSLFQFSLICAFNATLYILMLV